MDVKIWPEIIKSAAQSDMGILALMILVICLLALVFFRKATEHIRLGIFLLFFAGVVLFTVSAVSRMSNKGQAITADTVQTPGAVATSTREIGGIWYADVQYTWGTSAIEQLDFTVDGERVVGTASFGTAPRQIVEGKLSKDQLYFLTNIDSTDGTRTFQYRGKIGESQIQFTLDNKGDPPTTFFAARTVAEARKLRQK